MDLGLEGRVALVMGASRGIGRAIAVALAREGARVAIASRSEERLRTRRRRRSARAPRRSSPTPPTSSGSRALPGRGRGRRSARSRSSSPTPAGRRSAAPSTTSSTSGRPPTARWCSRRGCWPAAVVPAMRERGWGRIVNVGSSSTREPIPCLNLSNTHRMAAVGFLKTLVARGRRRRDHRQHGRHRPLRHRAAGGRRRLARRPPKRRRAREVPAGRLGRPEEYGDLVAFLCSERAAYITGTVIPIDGGLLHSASERRSDMRLDVIGRRRSRSSSRIAG